MPPETHTNRKATHHGCLPSLLGDGYKGMETVYGEEENILGGEGQVERTGRII